MDKKQEIHDLDKYLRSKGGANFEKYYKAGVSGLTDIDIAYVKNGYLIFNEEKETTRDVLPLQYSQFMLFKTLYELNPEKVRCFISVWFDNEIFVFDIRTLIKRSKQLIEGKHTFYEPWRKVSNYPLMYADKTYDEIAYYNWFANQTRECD